MPAPEPTPIAVMLSGGGRTMLNLLKEIDAGALRAHIRCVIASRECPGAEHARARNIPTHILPGEIPPGRLAQVLRDHGAQWAVLAGYLKKVIVPPGFEGRVVNIHPALLPLYGGPGMYGHHVHQAVLAAGDRESGCTVHLCDEHYDHGPIVLQGRCPVLPDDTPETLAARVFEVECRTYPRALRLLFEGQCKPAQ